MLFAFFSFIMMYSIDVFAITASELMAQSNKFLQSRVDSLEKHSALQQEFIEECLVNNGVRSDMLTSFFFRTLYGVPLDMIIKKIVPEKFKVHKNKVSFSVQTVVGALLDKNIFPRFMAPYKKLPLYDRACWALGYMFNVAGSYLLASKISDGITGVFTKS